MDRIPLEDNYTDIIGKAQRGFKLSNEDLARRAGISVEELARVLNGELEDALLRKIARSLNLGKTTLVESARKGWYPEPQAVAGVAWFNTPYEDMTVNSYLVWDAERREGIAFDTGADCRPLLARAKAEDIALKLILLTHTHTDHIIELRRLREETGAPVFVGERETAPDAQPFAEGKTFALGKLQIATRLTWGHSPGGITYVIAGLARPLAVVGDAMFAGSMGGGGISYVDALGNNRTKILTLSDDTVLCPGHGPLTTVREEKLHNPFFPEFQKN